VQCLGVGWTAFPAGEEQVYRTDDAVRQHRNVGRGGDPTKCLLQRQVGSDDRGSLCDQREACAPRVGQAGTQSVASDDQRDYRHGKGREQADQNVDEVVDDGARAGGVAYCAR